MVGLKAQSSKHPSRGECVENGELDAREVGKENIAEEQTLQQKRQFWNSECL